MAYTEDQLKAAAKKAYAAGDTAAAEELFQAAMAMRSPDQVNRQAMADRIASAKAGTLQMTPQRQAQQAAIDTTAEQNMRDPGSLSAFVQGAGQGATFGFADEILGGAAGAKAGLGAAMRGDFSGMGDAASQGYADMRDKARASFENAQFARPKTTLAGQVAGSAIVPAGATGTAANVGGKMLAGAGAGAAQGALYGFGSGEGGVGPRIDNATDAGLFGGAIGGAIPGMSALGAALVKKLRDSGAANAMVKAAPSLDDLRSQASAIFNQADQVQGLPRSALQTAAPGLIDAAKRKGMDEMLTPQSARAADRIMGEAASPSPTMGFRDLDILRRQAQIPAGNTSIPTEAAIGSGLVNGIDDVLNTAAPSLSGDVAKARSMWGQLRRTETIDEAIRRGETAASGAENGIRNEIRAILKNKNRLKGFSAEEIKAMERVVNGTMSANLLKKIGKFGPGIAQQTNHLGATMGGGGGGAAGAMIGGPVGAAIGAVAVPSIGYAAQKLAERSTRKGAEMLRALTASGGVLPKGKQVDALKQAFLERLMQQGNAAIRPIYSGNTVQVPQ